MRYILDNEGYVELCSQTHIECNGRGCTEYTGTIPAGYSSLEDWANNANIRAYKLVEGNLVYDANREAVLQSKCEKEHEDNRYVCHKEISNLNNLVKSDTANNYLTSTSNSSNLIEVSDSNKFASTYIELVANETITNKVHIKFNNGNLLTNDTTSKRESGISFEVKPDRTIYINGTATNDVEYDIGGYSNNTKPILVFKKEINYYLSSDGYQIKMYHFDGTNRTQIYSGNGGVINFTDGDNLVTQIVLVIPNTTNINGIIKPMLNVGNAAKDYITYEGNDTVIYLGEKTFSEGNNIKVENGTPILQNSIRLDDVEMPATYLDLTYMYCMENVNLKVTYPNKQRNNDLTGYETPNGAFAIDEEGNMYCNNATITGGIIDLTSPDGSPVIKVKNTDGAYSAISGREVGMVSADGMRMLALSNYEGTNPYLVLDNEFEDGGGQTILSSTGLSINGASIEAFKVSPTQPTNNEKVWIQKGKNLLYTPYTENNKLIWHSEYNDQFWHTGYKCYLEAGKTYTFSCELDTDDTSIHKFEAFLLKDNGYELYYALTSNPFTFFPTQTGYYYLRVDFNNQGQTYSYWNFQVEEGGTKTEYEPYIDKKIYIKNDGGSYSEFYNETKLQKYSTSEQAIGTWIDEKPLYRRVLVGTTNNNSYVIVGVLKDCENLVSIGGTIKDNTGCINPINFSWSETLKNVCQLIDGNQLALTYGSSFANCEYKIIAEYTKTTD